MKTSTNFVILIGYLILCQTMVKSSIITGYSDKTTFTTESQSAGTISFTDDLNSGSKVVNVITRDKLTISATDGVLFAFPNSVAANTIDGSGYLRARFDLSGETLTFTFNNPILSFGFDVNPRIQGVGDILSVDAAGASSTLTMPSSDTTEFRGFVSDTEFSTFTLGYTDNAGELYGIDNLVAYSAVPEPQTYTGIFAFGLVVFVSVRRIFLIGKMT